MIQPNFGIMLWAIFVFWCIKVPTSIIAGIAGNGKPKEYGAGDVLDGIITFLLILWVLMG